MKKELYTIGEVGKICNISTKALRFYDKIGLIAPDRVSEENNYRLYSRETLLFVPVVKYFKQMGFSLEEMKEFMEGNTFSAYKASFEQKLRELKRREDEIHTAYTSIRDWYNLIQEAESVIENEATQVSVKYVERMNTCYCEQPFDGSYMESVINIEWTNYLESIDCDITGPVIFWFEDYKAKLEGQKTRVRVMQKIINECEEDRMMDIGGCMMMSCYHIGSYDFIGKTYEKMQSWAQVNGYKCANDAIERCVTDYWTTRNKEKFVTEVLIRIHKDSIKGFL